MRRLVLPASVLIICPDPIDLATMAGTLSGNFAVLAAHDLDEAARLLDRTGPCRLAYCEVGDDAETTLEGMRRLGRAGMEVIALIRPPCPQAVREAAANGRVQGVYQLPLLPESLLAQTREMLCRVCPPPSYGRQQACVLTREEVAFLLNEFLYDSDAAAPLASGRRL
jgi:hypothetical protein